MKKLFTILTLTLVSIANAQSFDFKNYEWDEEFKPYKLAEGEEEWGEILLTKKRIIELVTSSQGAYMYSLYHEKVFLNSEEAIERNNKIYVPVSFDQSIEKQMARVVKPNGEIIELDNDDILEATDEESEKKYYYFAIEGLEKGSTLEYISVLKYLPSLSGTYYYFQEEYPIKNGSFEFYYPNHLVMDYKSYNGFPEMQQDTTYESDDDVIRYYAEVKDMAALKDEKYQNYKTNLQGVAYKLIRNKSNGQNNMYSFSTVAENLYNFMSVETDKKEDKWLNSIITESKADVASDKVAAIKAIENYVKQNIFYDEDAPESTETLAGIMTSKVANQSGIVLLYSKLFQKLDIEMTMVASCDRFEGVFDQKFENFSDLKNFVLYFPKQKSFLDPENILLRYPYITEGIAANHGLFIQPFEIGGVKLAKAKIKYIDPLDMKQSVDSLNIFVDLNKSIDEPLFNFYDASSGYYAIEQSLFDFIKDEEDKKELRETKVKYIDPDAKVENLKSENEGAENYGAKPFIVSCEFKSNTFIEKAGNSYIFKLGELIGPQTEMYDTDERQTDIEIENCQTYVRQISFVIPDGYTLKNIEKCEKKLVFKNDDGKDLFGFVTTYKIDGNTVTVHNTEYYNEIRLNKEKYYEDYIKVINAAADFNKIAVVLEK